MAAGKYRDRIVVEENTPTTNDAGQLRPKWSLYCARWASVRASGGREEFREVQNRAEVTHLVELPWGRVAAGIKPEMRVLSEGRVLNVTRAFDPTGLRKEIHLECLEIID